MKQIQTLVPSERASLWYYENKDKPEFKEKQRSRLKLWRTKYPERYLWQRAKDRAMFLGIPFNIDPEDIIIPSKCPALGTEFKFGTRYAASLDKIIPEFGYVKGNIQVISRKANLMKQDASKEELRNFAQWAIKTFQD